jgi:hypothetical protein
LVSSQVPIIPITKNAMPSRRNVGRHPIDPIKLVAMGPMIAEPAPYPPTINPTTSPRLSGNHLEATGVGVAYPNPLPAPTRMPNTP